MSYGSISKEAHEALAVAMNRIGGKSNTGEGGEDPARYFPEANGDSRNSASSRSLPDALALPVIIWSTLKSCRSRSRRERSPAKADNFRVTKFIRRLRRCDIRRQVWASSRRRRITTSIPSKIWRELIYDLKNANHHARISVKLVAEVGVGTVAAGVAKAHADVVLISGYDGGTGASPLSSIKHAGVPWELGLAETHQTLAAQQPS